ncbi:hypothetical protein VTI28DRAFT_526 [Corynascus sepedonium]
MLFLPGREARDSTSRNICICRSQIDSFIVARNCISGLCIQIVIVHTPGGHFGGRETLRFRPLSCLQPFNTMLKAGFRNRLYLFPWISL